MYDPLASIEDDEAQIQASHMVGDGQSGLTAADDDDIEPPWEPLL